MKENFVLGRIASDYRTGLGKSQSQAFCEYVCGKKVAHPWHGEINILEEQIVADWTLNNSEDIQRYREIGRTWLPLSLLRVPDPGVAISNNYVPKPHLIKIHGEPQLPAPTFDDLAEIRNQFGAEGVYWKFERTIYQNPNGSNPNGSNLRRIIHLFALVDDFGRIKKRIAVKVQGEYTYNDIQMILETEGGIHTNLAQLGCSNILNILGTSYRKLNSSHYLGYIYLEWAPYGSLSDLVLADPPTASSGRSRQLPEPFLWLVFRALAEALLAMLTGDVIGHAEPWEEDSEVQNIDIKNWGKWHPIVNPDIKLMNVVLGDAQENWYPAYKTPKMIDFGLAQYQDDIYGRYSKMSMTGCIGTPGEEPPEQIWPPHRDYVNFAIDERSHVWNVGKIMLELMEQRHIVVDSAGFRFNHTAKYQNGGKSYSFALEKLVQECLEAKSPDRPQLMQLLWRTKNGLQDWEHANTSVAGKNVPDYFTWPWKEEQLPIGSYTPGHWGWARKWRPGSAGNEDDHVDDNGNNRNDDDESNESRPASPINSEHTKRLPRGDGKPHHISSRERLVPDDDELRDESPPLPKKQRRENKGELRQSGQKREKMKVPR
ncbi:kinase-like domain-containing protein [Phaeosphaeriaceae sp. PMI808]|nr:kinase-like domain-containing protein [Phaeosphaeriaceae sp. PMI808]